jgi:hypothetical protein
MTDSSLTIDIESGAGTSSSADARPLGPATSVARAYRRRRDRERRPFRLATATLLVLSVVSLGLYYGMGGFSGGNLSSQATGNDSAGGPGTEIALPFVTFGTPVVHNATCGDGRAFPVETVPWTSSNVPISTQGIFLELIESIDGDVDGGPAPAPSVSLSDVCSSAPPNTFPSWYAVLQGPSGQNSAYYSYNQGWVMLDPSVSTITIANDSALVFVQLPLPAGLSFELCVLSIVHAPPIDDCVLL